jgi:MFS family permease
LRHSGVFRYGSESGNLYFRMSTKQKDMKTNKNIMLLYLFSFFKNLQFFGAVSVPFYLHRVGLDYTGMFLLEAIFSFSMILFEIPTGVVADRWGRKRSLLSGSFFFGAGFFLFGIFTSYPILVFAEIICAFGMTLLSGADRALLYEMLKNGHEEDRAVKVLARYDAFSTAAMFLAFPVGSVFAGSSIVSYKTSLGLVFIATAAAIFLSGLIMLFIKEGPFEKSTNPVFRHGMDGFLAILKIPRLRVFSLNYAFISSMTFFMFWYYQSLLMKNGFPVAWQGFIASAFNLTAMTLLFFTPFVERNLGLKNTLFMSSLIPGALFLLVSVIPGSIMAIIAIFGVTNLKALRAPVLIALMNREIESSNRATILSGVSMIERIAMTLLYPVAGILTDISLNTALLAIGIITIILSIALRVEEAAIKGD